ncbi:MAG: hypothetical protein J6S89_11920 [Paludibacteraceae bacterium]|nr:hypothetical protein [Paludibacteraceae bacterium]
MEALGKLNGNEIKKASKTIMSIKKNSDAGGLRAHKIEHPCGAIVSYSVNMDVRIIAYQKDQDVTFLYIDHHDDAYHWVQNRNVFCGPNNDIRIVTTTESTPPIAFEAIIPYSNKKTVKAEITPEMVESLRNISSDEDLFTYIEKQPEELQEKLFDIAMRALKAKSCKISNKFEVRVVTDDKILEDALNYPLERWRIFLHPKQETVISTPIGQSVLITGAPGTGKTVCLIHKAKKLEKFIKDGECIIISTFKETLKDYLLQMLSALSYDKEKIFLVDISLLNQIKDKTITENLDGFFRWQNNNLYYYRKNVKYLVRHILFDEYQDFTKGSLATILQMTTIVPFTISYDYSQSIYKAIKRSVETLEDANVNKYILDYSYRVNSRILIKLKRIMKLISMLSHENDIQGGVTEEERQIINTTQSAIEGSDIRLLSYSTQEEKDVLLEDEYNSYRNAYKSDEVVVTQFIPDFYCNLQKDEDFKSSDIPLSVRSSYLYLPTLKGKEYKAGIIILDDVVCQLLNINRILFNRIDSTLKSPKQNVRFYLNLLYVALSRFRDYITIMYPKEYKETITPILEA